MSVKRRSCKSFRISDILGHEDVDENDNLISNKEKEYSSPTLRQNFEQREKLFEDEKHQEKHEEYGIHSSPIDERYMILSSRYEKEMKNFEATNGNRSPSYYYEQFDSPSYRNWLPWIPGALQYRDEIDLNGTMLRKLLSRKDVRDFS